MKNRLNLRKLTVAAVTLSLALFTFGSATAAAQTAGATGHERTSIPTPQQPGLAYFRGECNETIKQQHLIASTNNASSPSIFLIYNFSSSSCPITLECEAGIYNEGYVYINPGASLYLFACGNSTTTIDVYADCYGACTGTYTVSIGASPYKTSE